MFFFDRRFPFAGPACPSQNLRMRRKLSGSGATTLLSLRPEKGPSRGRKFQTEGVQQLGADARLAEMPVDGLVSVTRIPDEGKAKRRHLGADLMGLSGEQLHLQAGAVLIGFQKPPARADGNRSGISRFFLIDSDLIAVFLPQKPALRQSARRAAFPRRRAGRICAGSGLGSARSSSGSRPAFSRR